MASVYLPRKWSTNMKNAVAASDGVRQLLTTVDPNYHVLYTHFLGDALPADWPAAKTNGTSAAVTVTGSALALVAGTDDNGYAGQGYAKHWGPSQGGVYFESRQYLDTTTTVKVEVGLTDATDDAGAVNAKSTPTLTATDCAVIILDTDHNAQVDVISGNGGTPSRDASNIGLDMGSSWTSEFRVGVTGNYSAYVNGARVASGTVDSFATLTPWVFAQTRAAAANRIHRTFYWIMAGGSDLGSGGGG